MQKTETGVLFDRPDASLVPYQVTPYISLTEPFGARGDSWERGVMLPILDIFVKASRHAVLLFVFMEPLSWIQLSLSSRIDWLPISWR